MDIIPTENLAYPIKVSVGFEYISTGFLINLEKESYFISAKHNFYEDGKILGERCDLLCQPQSNDLDDIIFVEMDLEWLDENDKILISDCSDVIAIKFSTYTGNNGIDLSKGIKLKERGESNLIGIPEIAIKPINQVRVSSEIFIQGYPESIGLIEVPQVDFDRPLVRKGIVAGINEEENSIIIDCQIFKGNSGSPVIMRSWRGEQIENSLIGLVSKYIPIKQQLKDKKFDDINYVLGNSGYAVVVPSDEIMKLIKGNN